ncbi:hypothetical protein H5410_033189 [Solanum commersonii]|uniref:Uncharacterized protein n=1 Tax=Solanum commersonii TaxID=4109 RepID=A0A9J5YM35_SOLCO|nr:hypothetical protein H5410_033189 [Solanum commersonii]
MAVLRNLHDDRCKRALEFVEDSNNGRMKLATTGTTAEVINLIEVYVNVLSPTVNKDPDVTQIHTKGPSSTVEESPMTIIEDVVPTVNEDPIVTQIHTTEPSSTVDSSPMTIIEDVVPTVNEDLDVTQIHTTKPSSTVDSSPTMIIEDIFPIVNEDPDVTQNVNIKDLRPKRKRDNEDEDGYTGLRPQDVLRISRKGCGT